MPCCSCGLEGPPLRVEAQRGCVVRELPTQHLFQRRGRRQTGSEEHLKAKDCWTPYSSAPFLSFTFGPSACLSESTGHPDPLPLSLWLLWAVAPPTSYSHSLLRSSNELLCFPNCPDGAGFQSLLSNSYCIASSAATIILHTQMTRPHAPVTLYGTPVVPL